MNKIIFILSALLLFGASACKNRKNRVVQPDIVNPVKDSAVKVVTAEDLLGFTLKDWQYFSSKIDVEYRNGEDKKNFNVNIRMLKDSLVWISAGLFGIEGVRVLINKDSMVVLNKIDKKYMVYKNEAISGLSDVPLTVGQIQNLIIAKPVYALKLYSIIANNDASVLIQYNQEKFATSHRYGKLFYTIDTTSVNDLTTRNYAMARYADYSVVNGHNFPLSAYITASNGSKLIQLDMKFEDTDFGTVVTFPFIIPSSYEKAQ
jgi:hypothetical protein